MSLLKLTWSRVRAVFKKRELDREFENEARTHLAFAADEYERQGVPVGEAQRLARVDFGSIEALKEAQRDSRGLPWLEGLFYDLRFALRGLRRDRAFSLIAIGMLALVIGLNVTVFMVMDAMLFRGYPLVKQNDRLVYLQEHTPSGMGNISYPDFEDWRAQAHAFEGIAFVGEKGINLQDGEGRPLDMLAFKVSANAFGLLGVPPMLGRDFVRADEEPGAPSVAILNYRFWENRFGKRSDIVGLGIHIDGEPAIIIGVMPRRFDFPTEANLWMPVVRTPELMKRVLTQFLAVGRLRQGAHLEEVRAEVETINRRLEAVYPATNRGVVPRVVDHLHWQAGPNGPIVYGSLWAGAFLVLLIACANLANLTLARTIGRWREFSTKVALGAGRVRLIRQIFAESLLLAAVAGALGWWIAKWSINTWASETASQFQILDYTLDSGTFAYLATISIAAAILLSLAPISKVVQLAKGALTNDGRGITHNSRAKHLASLLVVIQTILAVVLLSGAGVLVRSLLNIVNARTGVRDPETLLVGHMTLPSDKYPSPAAKREYFGHLHTQLKALPGVEDESLSSTIPVNNVPLRTFEIEGTPRLADGGPSVEFLNAGSGYFRVVGASPISGREFDDGDQMTAVPVAIVNQAFADAFWPNENPLGKRLRTITRDTPGEWRIVVGVVPNIMQGDPTRQHFKQLVYIPLDQDPKPPTRVYFLARTHLPPGNVARSVRDEIQKIDADVDLGNFTTLKASFAFDRDRMDVEHMEMGKSAAVAPIFAATALLLAAMGLYAVIAYSVGQRTIEIGVRMAIGAGATNIQRMIFRDGMLPVGTGIILGFGASLGVNRILQSQLVALSPYDPLTMTGAPILLVTIAMVACYIPARRATRIDPAVTLRHD